MADTSIEWADKVWNPVTGCTKVSEGCRNCYAERYANRFWMERRFSDIHCHEDRLDQPLHWRKPVRVFVNSMSDLFHPDVPDRLIDHVFQVMENAYKHTFIILTKRPDRMIKLLNDPTFRYVVKNGPWPISNVWLGVSIEDQKTADERIPLLLQTPAAVRFVSYEPALGPVDLAYPLNGCPEPYGDVLNDPQWEQTAPPINWVICGGESGPNARPIHPDWARSLRDQCIAASVPFFFKQWGEWARDPYAPITNSPTGREIFIKSDGSFGNQGDYWDGTATAMKMMGKKAAGSLLDGKEWKQFPEMRKNE